MQFSDSTSSSSSVSPLQRQPHTGRGGSADVPPAPLPNASHVFEASSAFRINGEEDSQDDVEGGRCPPVDPESTLRIHLTSNLNRASGSASPAPAEWHGATQGNGGSSNRPCAASAQGAPPFFAQRAGPHAGAENSNSVAKPNVRVFHEIVSSSSSIASSPPSQLTVTNPPLHGVRLSPNTRRQLELHRSASTENSETTSTTSTPISPPAALRHQRSASSESSSGSSTSVIVLQRLSLVRGTTKDAASLAPGLAGSKAPGDGSQAQQRAVPSHLIGAAAAVANADSLRTGQNDEGVTRATSASTLTDTARTGAASASFLISSAHPASLTTIASQHGGAERETEAPTPASLTNGQVSGSPPLGTMQTTTTRSSTVNSDTRSIPDPEDDNEDGLCSSSASRAAQAALDAADAHDGHDESHSHSSPALSAIEAHWSSEQAAPTVSPQGILEAAGNPVDIPDPLLSTPEEKFVGNVDEFGERKEDCAADGLVGVDALQDRAGGHLLSPLEANPMDSRFSGCAASTVPTAFVAMRRVPPPPPTPSTATRKSPSPSTVRHDLARSDDTDTSQTDFTAEQVNAVAVTQSTFNTQTTSVEVEQAAVHYSASLLPPTRSSSSNSASGSAGFGCARHPSFTETEHAQRIPRVVATDRGEYDDGGVISPPHPITDFSSIAEEGSAEEGLASTKAPSLVTAGGTMTTVTVMDAVAVTVSRTDLKRPSYHQPFPDASTTDFHGETLSTTGAVLTTFSADGEVSSSRTSAVLMPPSPSLPRAPSLSPCDEASSNTIKDDELALAHQNRDSRRASLERSVEKAISTPGRIQVVPVSPPRQPPHGSTSSSPPVQRSTSPIYADVAGAARETISEGNEVHRTSAPLSSEFQTSDVDVCDVKGATAAANCSAMSTRTISDLQPPFAPSTARSSATENGEREDTALDVDSVGDHTPRVTNVDEIESAENEETSTIHWENHQAPDDDDNSDPLTISEAGRWNSVLAEMTLIDSTILSRVYRQSPPTRHPTRIMEREDAEEEKSSADQGSCVFKVLSLFPTAISDARARWPQRIDVQKKLLKLAASMRATQRALSEAGLTVAATSTEETEEDSSSDALAGSTDAGGARRERRSTCAGVAAVYVDSSCRLIAQLEEEPYAVPLRHAVAARCGTGLRESEVLAVLRLVVSKAATMHRAGFVHGALHAGNVFLSSYDGNAVLAQPCGLMSQSAWLPSDLSVISVRRARAMARFLPQVWSSRQPCWGTPMSTRLGAPPRLDVEELITYHNLVSSGWSNDLADMDGAAATDTDTGANPRDGGLEIAPYIPTTVDDLYALGMMAFFLYLGVPPFHMVSLWAAVERLSTLCLDYEAALQAPSPHLRARRVVAEFCFGTQRQRSRSGSTSSTGSCQEAPLSSAESLEQPLELPELFSCAYGSTQRHTVGQFRPAFEHALRNFIVDCVEASCQAALDADKDSSVMHGEASAWCLEYRSAEDLLQRHPLFDLFAANATVRKSEQEKQDGEGSLESAEERMLDIVHRLAFPAYSSWCRVQDDCGSSPHLPRCHCNALYTARCTALCESVLAASSDKFAVLPPKLSSNEKGALGSALSVLCPQVAGTLRSWHATFPSVDANTLGCGRSGPSLKSDVTRRSKPRSRDPWDGSVRAATNRYPPCTFSSLVLPSSETSPEPLAGDGHHGQSPLSTAAAVTASGSQSEGVVMAAILSGKTDSAAGDFMYLRHLHALVLSNKQDAAYSMSRSYVLTHILPAADTLVLRDLTECNVTILAPFRYVVLDGLRRCEVRLGPCELCVMRHVRESPFIAVAAGGIFGGHVTDSHISWSCQGGPLSLERSHSIRSSLYGLVYQGLGEDYTRVGLPFEMKPSFRLRERSADATQMPSSGDDGNTTPDASSLRRSVELMATAATSAGPGYIGAALCLAPEIPYAHALLAHGTQYICHGRRTGGPQSLWVQPPDVFHFERELDGKDASVRDVHGGPSGTLRPVVCLLGALGEVTIDHCSYCTILIAGSRNNVQVSHCHDCQIQVMTRECAVKNCARMEVAALVTEYLLFLECHDIRVRPLFLDCPFSDEILRGIVEESEEEADAELVMNAYQDGKIEVLNAVLRGVDRGVCVEASTNVVVDDLEHYRRHGRSEEKSFDEAGESQGAETAFGVLEVPFVSTADTSQEAASLYMVQAAHFLSEELDVPCLVEPLQRYGAGEMNVTASYRDGRRPTIAFQNLVDCSILRLRGSLCPVNDLEDPLDIEALPPDATLVDICVDRIQGGILYIEDAVHSLLLRNCVGPLEVVLCAARTVVMEACTGVQLRTACCDFRASNCVGCHVALHVNNPPQYYRCTSMETSVLNITARDYEEMLEEAGVELSLNTFDAPLLLTEEWVPTVTSSERPATSLDSTAIHASCSGSANVCLSSRAIAELCAQLRIGEQQRLEGKTRTAVLLAEQAPLIMSLLRQPVTIVPPLPGLCVSPEDAPFIEEFEDRVAAWMQPSQQLSQQQGIASRKDAIEVALHALADVAAVYSQVPEWSASAIALPLDTEPALASEGHEDELRAPKQAPLQDNEQRSPPSSKERQPMDLGTAPSLSSNAEGGSSCHASSEEDVEDELSRSAGAAELTSANSSTSVDDEREGHGVVAEAAAEERDSNQIDRDCTQAEPPQMQQLATEVQPGMEVSKQAPPSLPPHHADPTLMMPMPRCAAPAEQRQRDPLTSDAPLPSESSPARGHSATVESLKPSVPLQISESGTTLSDFTATNASAASSAAPPPPPGPSKALNLISVDTSSMDDTFRRAAEDTLSVNTRVTAPVVGEGELDASNPDVTRRLHDTGLDRLASSAAADSIQSSPAAAESADACALEASSVCADDNKERQETRQLSHNMTLAEVPSEPRQPSSLGQSELPARSPHCVTPQKLSIANENPTEVGTEQRETGTEAHASVTHIGILDPPRGHDAHFPQCLNEPPFESTRASSSSVAECPNRVPDGQENGAGQVSTGNRSGSTGDQQIRFLHVSHDSAHRQLESNYPIITNALASTAASITGRTDVEHGIAQARSDGLLAMPSTSHEVTMMSEVPPELQKLLRQVKEARERFTHHQRMWGSAETLEARIMAAVAKLKSSPAHPGPT